MGWKLDRNPVPSSGTCIKFPHHSALETDTGCAVVEPAIRSGLGARASASQRGTVRVSNQLTRVTMRSFQRACQHPQPREVPRAKRQFHLPQGTSNVSCTCTGNFGSSAGGLRGHTRGRENRVAKAAHLSVSAPHIVRCVDVGRMWHFPCLRYIIVKTNTDLEFSPPHGECSAVRAAVYALFIKRNGSAAD